MQTETSTREWLKNKVWHLGNLLAAKVNYRINLDCISTR